MPATRCRHLNRAPRLTSVPKLSGAIFAAASATVSQPLKEPYDPWQPATHFKFPDDHGSLASATLRCVGVGKCCREAGGVMCPSYRVTRDE